MRLIFINYFTKTDFVHFWFWLWAAHRVIECPSIQPITSLRQVPTNSGDSSGTVGSLVLSGQRGRVSEPRRSSIRSISAEEEGNGIEPGEGEREERDTKRSHWLLRHISPLEIHYSDMQTSRPLWCHSLSSSLSPSLPLSFESVLWMHSPCFTHWRVLSERGI